MENLYGYLCNLLTEIIAKMDVHSIYVFIVTFYTSYLLGNWYLVQLWFVLMCSELILQVVRVWKEEHSLFNKISLVWAVKLITHLASIVLVGSLSKASSDLGYISSAFVIDGYMSMMVACQTGLVIKLAEVVRLPIPDSLKWLSLIMKSKVDTTVSKYIGKHHENNTINK